MRRLILLIVVFTACYAHVALPCSTFYIPNDGQPVFGKNYDWDVDDGLVIVNKRAMSKTAMTADNPAQWTSKYGSVTFNQYGRELPAGGMNEAGLVVELLWLNETEYSKPDARPSIGNVQWIQYQLDVSATVQEVIASDAQIRISDEGYSKIHYLVADRNGSSATIEFVGGEMVYHTAESMPVGALTNNTYAASMKYVDERGGFDRAGHSAGSGSLARFARAADKVHAYEPQVISTTVDFAFEVLADVAQGSHTKWSIVHDIVGRRIFFKTHRERDRREIRLTHLDFTCSSPVEVLDINARLSGDVSGRFIPYTQELNHDLIMRSFRKTDFLSGVPTATLDRLSRYPDGTTCKERIASE